LGRKTPNDERKRLAARSGPRDRGTQKKLVARLPYIIAYAVTKEAGREVVSILRVAHLASGIDFLLIYPKLSKKKTARACPGP
jgi:hypothetical protein